MFEAHSRVDVVHADVEVDRYFVGVIAGVDHVGEGPCRQAMSVDAGCASLDSWVDPDAGSRPPQLCDLVGVVFDGLEHGLDELEERALPTLASVDPIAKIGEEGAADRGEASMSQRAVHAQFVAQDGDASAEVVVADVPAMEFRRNVHGDEVKEREVRVERGCDDCRQVTVRSCPSPNDVWMELRQPR